MVFTVEEKAKILALKEQNMSNFKISKKLKCNESSVRRFLEKYKKTGSLARQKGSGRPKCTTLREERLIKSIVLKDRFKYAGNIKTEFKEDTGKDFSERTMQRRLNEIGFEARRPAKKPLLNNKMKKNRLDWAKLHKTWTMNDWEKVVFSDESKFNLIGPDGRATVRRRAGERYSEKCTVATVKHSPYVMVWGAITNFGCGKILILDGMVNALKYKEIIEDGVLPTLDQLSEFVPNTIFQDDSAPCYRANSVINS